MTHRPFLYIARQNQPPKNKAPLYLPEGYKERKRRETAGVAKSGEISQKGLVSHTEDWEGRVAANASPATIVYTRDPDGRWRPMTHQEMVDRGYFRPGQGPVGIRKDGHGGNGGN